MKPRTAGLTVTLFLGLAAAGCFQPPKHGTDVKITSPPDGGAVAQADIVRGTSRNVPAGEKIWVVLFIPRVARYYPQDNPAVVQPDGNWNSPAYFGLRTTDDSGVRFEVYAVTVNGAGQTAFQNYLKDASDKNDFAGLKQLPEGVTQQHSVTVTRK